ncbi:HPr family phosphocarrier protein [Georgenia deserti]|uniref:Phosphocarrier protein HPr n=1 Tax=Georgenia deserti TaxID=2093781 RepID=A0ABW4L6E7_9MICO
MSAAPTRQAMIETIVRARVTPTVRAADFEQADRWARAVVDGGLHVFEFTATTPGWVSAVARWSSEDSATVGLGTVTSAEVAEQAVDAGAAFLVSPFRVPEARKVADRHGVLLIEGGLTPNEVREAGRHGLAKLFPAGLGGLDYLKSLRSVLPGTPIAATGGIAVDQARTWLEAGAASVSIGSDLFAGPDVASAARALAASVADVPLPAFLDDGGDGPEEAAASEVVATIGDPSGLHARPASEIAKTVRAAGGAVTLTGPDGEEVDARSMLAVMGRNYQHGMTITVAASGPDAERVARDVATILEAS